MKLHVSTNSKKGKLLLILLVVAIVVLLSAVGYAVMISRPAPRTVAAEIPRNGGLQYNRTSDQLTLYVNFTPPDDFMYLSRIAFQTSPSVSFLRHDPLYKNGTIVKVVVTNYSICFGTIFSGTPVIVEFYFSDVHTHREVAKTELTIVLP